MHFKDGEGWYQKYATEEWTPHQKAILEKK